MQRSGALSPAPRAQPSLPRPAVYGATPLNGAGQRGLAPSRRLRTTLPRPPSAQPHLRRAFAPRRLHTPCSNASNAPLAPRGAGATSTFAHDPHAPPPSRLLPRANQHQHSLPRRTPAAAPHTLRGLPPRVPPRLRCQPDAERTPTLPWRACKDSTIAKLRTDAARPRRPHVPKPHLQNPHPNRQQQCAPLPPNYHHHPGLHDNTPHGHRAADNMVTCGGRRPPPGEPHPRRGLYGGDPLGSEPHC